MQSDLADEQLLLRQYLAGRDVACPQCSYNVRDLNGDICPECGERLALRLQLLELRQAAPIAGLVGLSSGAGFNGLLLIYFFLMTFVRRLGPGGREMWRFLGVLSIGLIVFAAALTFWLRHWRAIRVMTGRRRWWLVSACWLLSLLDLFIFTATIR